MFFVSDHFFGTQRKTYYVHSFAIRHYFIILHATLDDYDYKIQFCILSWLGKVKHSLFTALWLKSLSLQTDFIKLVIFKKKPTWNIFEQK